MMKKTYIAPAMEKEVFETLDVITVSILTVHPTYTGDPMLESSVGK